MSWDDDFEFGQYNEMARRVQAVQVITGSALDLQGRVGFSTGFVTTAYS